jgi:hypothetical protein
MRKDLSKKLTDASLVKRYETGENESEWNDGEGKKETSTEIKTVGDCDFFTLNPLEAMELTSTKRSFASASASASASATNACKPSFENDTPADQTNNVDSEISHYQYVYSNEFNLAGKRNYLTLRHEQNSAWAQLQFIKGIGYAKAALNPSCEQTSTRALVNKAEVCYKEGLEMIPHHPRLLTAYGALCINDGRLEMARDLLIKSIALLQKDNSDEENEVDSDTLKDANTYLNVVDSKLHAKARMISQAKKGQVQLSNKAEQAMNDALAERAFSMGNDVTKNNSTSFKASVGMSERGARGQSDEYQLLSSSSDSETESTRRRRRKRSRSRDKRRKHRKREKRKSGGRNKRDRDYDSLRKHKRRGDRHELSVGDEDDNNDDDECKIGDRHERQIGDDDIGKNDDAKHNRRGDRHERSVGDENGNNDDDISVSVESSGRKRDIDYDSLRKHKRRRDRNERSVGDEDGNNDNYKRERRGDRHEESVGDEDGNNDDDKHKRRGDQHERSVGYGDGNNEDDSSASLKSSRRDRKNHKKRYRKISNNTSRREKSRDSTRSRSISRAR